MKLANGLKNRPESSSKLVIMSVIETLKINFVQVNPGLKTVQDLLGTVSVGDKAILAPGSAGFVDNGNPPFRGDQRLIVGAHENRGALLESGGNQHFGSELQRGANGLRIT